MKTVICIWGNAGIGKTSVIRMVFDKLNVAGAIPQKKFGDDFCTTLDCRNGKIGFASMGDPNSEQENCLNDLREQACEIIVCASRTRGNTVDAVCRLADSGYRVIWTSPFSCAETSAFVQNDLFASAVIELINKFLNVK